MRLTFVGPEGQVVSYSGHAVPTGEALRAFVAHGWRPKDRRQVETPAPAPAPDQTQPPSR